MSGEEVLLRGLYELVSGADQHEITAIFGKDQTITGKTCIGKLLEFIEILTLNC